jgi:hypothetical protein
MTITKQDPTVLFVEFITAKGNRQALMSTRWESIGVAQRELVESMRSKGIASYSDCDKEGRSTDRLLIVSFDEVTFVKVQPVTSPREPQDTVSVLVRDHA